MNLKVVVAILLVAAVPMYAHAQNPRVSEGDAEKVATIISGDKIKIRAYCDIHKLAKQVAEVNQKKDGEKVNELLEEIEILEKTIRPEYAALIAGIQDITENEQLRAEFSSAFGALVTRAEFCIGIISTINLFIKVKGTVAIWLQGDIESTSLILKSEIYNFHRLDLTLQAGFIVTVYDRYEPMCNAYRGVGGTPKNCRQLNRGTKKEINCGERNCHG
jgi:hypothetical protein